MFIKLTKIIFDPVKARVLYDYGISLIILILVSLFFIGFGYTGVSAIELFLFPLVFVLCNSLLGIYTSKKMAPVVEKSLLLLLSIAIDYLFLRIMFGITNLPLSIGAFIITLLSIMPRVFFNFPTTNKRNIRITTVIRASSPILVVGGGGYIGSVLIESLLRKNYKVRVLDKFLYGRSAIKPLEKHRNLEVIEGDVSNLYDVTFALKNVQAVVHLAGIVGDPAASLDQKLTRHMNIVSTRMLKETVKAFNIEKFIFASSCSVYGATKTIATENSRPNPVSLYAQSKIDSENELLRDTYDTFHPTIFRFATVFGHSYRPRFDLVANLFIAQALYEGKIRVMTADQWRPFIHVADISDAIIAVLESPTEKVSRQIFNVGDDRLNMTIGGLANIVKNIVENDRKVRVLIDKNMSDKRNYQVSFKKIQSQLNFSASTTLEEGLQEIYYHAKKGTYNKPFTDPIYNNFLMTKKLMKEYYSKTYQHSHFSTLE